MVPKGVLVNVTGSMDIGLDEVEQAATLVQQAAHPDANIIFGATFDENMEDEIRVTVIVPASMRVLRREASVKSLSLQLKKRLSSRQPKKSLLRRRATGSRRGRACTCTGIHCG